MAELTAVLVAYDPSWPDQFELAAAGLKQVGNPQWIVEHIGRRFPDWHPLDARRYEGVKLSAAEAAAAGRGPYNEAKTAVVQEIIDRARVERGLPQV